MKWMYLLFRGMSLCYLGIHLIEVITDLASGVILSWSWLLLVCSIML